jgi:hypothetical protein
MIAARVRPTAITGSSNIALARTAPAMPSVIFVARLPSPCREAVTLVELEGPSIREAAEVVSISARCLRGVREQIRQDLDQTRRVDVQHQRHCDLPVAVGRATIRR